jgi:hypothetical protein
MRPSGKRPAAPKTYKRSERTEPRKREQGRRAIVKNFEKSFQMGCTVRRYD